MCARLTIEWSLRFPFVYPTLPVSSVPSIMVSMMGDVNIVYLNIDFLNETFFYGLHFHENVFRIIMEMIV